MRALDKKFSRNIPSISVAEQALLRQKKAFVAGCGGLGGYICEYLVRAGVGAIAAADGDFFEETNLNRQLLSLQSTLGVNKAFAAAKRAKEINPEVEFTPFDEFFSAEKADAMLSGADIVIDALDNPADRILLEEECGKRGLYLVHGAISGWNAQISVVKPNSGLLKTLYANSAPSPSGCLCPTPAACAALQSAETLKILCGKNSSLEGKLLLADLFNMEFDIIEL